MFVLNTFRKSLSVAALVLYFSVAGLSQSYLGGLSIRYVGEYGGVPWTRPGTAIRPGSRKYRAKDLNLAISSINLSDKMSDKFLAGWNSAAKLGMEQGKAFLPRVYFWAGDRVRGKLKSIDYYWNRMDRFLSAMKLENFYGISLAEENVVSRASILADLYKRIKSKYPELRVYQWWSPCTTVPEYRIPADGWIVDIYNYGGDRFRKYVQRYLVTGKPLIIMPYASWVEGDPVWSNKQWRILFDQLQVAREYNLPTAFYWTYGRKGGGGTGVHFGMCENNFMGKINRVILSWIREVRSYPEDYDGLDSADCSEGRVLEIGPTDRNGNFIYRDSLDTSQFILDADIRGFRNILWERARRLAIRSWNHKDKPFVSLTYRFGGDFKLRYPIVYLEVPFLANGSSVVLSTSTDGDHWDCRANFNKGKRFVKIDTTGNKKYSATNSLFVRIAIKGSLANGICVRIDNLSVRGKLLLSAHPVIKLKPSKDNPNILVFEDDFQTRRYLYEAKVIDREKLEWSRGRIAVRLRPGGTKAALIWCVKTDKPVRNVVVDVTGRANNGSLGTNHYLAISLDGKKWVSEVDTTKLKHNISGWAYHGLKIDTRGNPAFDGINCFYVRVRMLANGYKKVHRYQSGIINKIRIQAEAIR